MPRYKLNNFILKKNILATLSCEIWKFKMLFQFETWRTLTPFPLLSRILPPLYPPLPYPSALPSPTLSNCLEANCLYVSLMLHLTAEQCILGQTDICSLLYFSVEWTHNKVGSIKLWKRKTTIDSVWKIVLAQWTRHIFN